MSIEKQRIEIDKIEDDLIRLVSKRAEYAKIIGAHKRSLGLPIFDPIRENEILERIAKKNPGPLSKDDLQNIFKSIIEVTRNFEGRHNDHDNG